MLPIFRRRAGKAIVEHDAARLMKAFGAQAHQTAGEMSWREDIGLMVSPGPGHWHRVQQEIARREGRASADAPLAKVAIHRTHDLSMGVRP